MTIMIGYAYYNGVSRNYFTPRSRIIVNNLSELDMRNIIINWKNGNTISWLSEYSEVSKRRIHQIISHFKWNKCSLIPRQLDRKQNKIPESEIELVLVYHYVYHLGPVALEKLIKIEEGLQIPHNRIYKILLSNNLVNHNPKKQ